MVIWWSYSDRFTGFCFVLVCLYCCTSASNHEVWLSGWRSVRVSLTFCLHWPCGMLCHLFSLPPRSVMSEFACRLHCKSSVAALAPVPLYIMDFALYELHLQIIWLEFCWHWLPHSLGVMYLHLWENTFPFFFPKGFLGFSYQADTPQISASPSQAEARFALSNNNYCVLSWKADWVSSIFFPWSGPHSR